MITLNGIDVMADLAQSCDGVESLWRLVTLLDEHRRWVSLVMVGVAGTQGSQKLQDEFTAGMVKGMSPDRFSPEVGFIRRGSLILELLSPETPEEAALRFAAFVYLANSIRHLPSALGETLHRWHSTLDKAQISKAQRQLNRSLLIENPTSALTGQPRVNKAAESGRIPKGSVDDRLEDQAGVIVAALEPRGVTVEGTDLERFAALARKWMGGIR